MGNRSSIDPNASGGVCSSTYLSEEQNFSTTPNFSQTNQASSELQDQFVYAESSYSLLTNPQRAPLKFDTPEAVAKNPKPKKTDFLDAAITDLTSDQSSVGDKVGDVLTIVVGGAVMALGGILTGCSGSDYTPPDSGDDAGPADSGPSQTDSGTTDAGNEVDAGLPDASDNDAGLTQPDDAGENLDGGFSADAGPPQADDAGYIDAGNPADAGNNTVDAGPGQSDGGVHQNCQNTPAGGLSSSVVLHLDHDGDRLGNPAIFDSFCEGDDRTGWVNNADDCDDTTPAIQLASDWCADEDRDGIGSRDSRATKSCTDPSTSTLTFVGSDGDNCPAVSNADQKDFDHDGVGDVCDTDRDGDGILNAADNCALIPNSNQADLDGDGVGDICDADVDGDGVADLQDNCPISANANQADSDFDGRGDVCDADSDGDGVLNAADNCSTTPNTNQADLDHNGIGDACDPDVDGDGIANTADNCLLIANTNQADLDRDGLGDVCDSDIDGDSDPNTSDCQPLNQSISHVATEVCDTVDNNCDGNIDEGVKTTFYRDDDGDTYGSSQSTQACTLPTGYSNNQTDCNDTLNAGVSIHPNATESCNGVDDNCNGQTDEGFVDTDSDGTKDCVDPDRDNDGILNTADNCVLVSNANQADLDGDGVGDICDTDVDGDGVADLQDNCPVNANANQADLDFDGRGDVCDTDRDGDGVLNAADNCPVNVNTNQANFDHDTLGDVCDADNDNDGIGDAAGDCEPFNASIFPGARELCNGVNDDCNASTLDGVGETNYNAQCGVSNVGSCRYGAMACLSGAMTCVGAVNPTTEVCNTIDDNCNGQTDEGVKTRFGHDVDGDRKGSSTDFTDACVAPTGYVNNLLDCNDSDPAIYLGAVELCDTKDNDCNVSTADGSGEASIGASCGYNGVGICRMGTNACVSGVMTCAGAINPATESCDGADNDCDGQTDEGFADLDNDGIKDCLDTDADGDGVNASSFGGTDCNDRNSAIKPGAADTVGDGIDQNCDGLDGVDVDGDAHASLATGGDDCDDTDTNVYPGATEVCNNGKADNCDDSSPDTCAYTGNINIASVSNVLNWTTAAQGATPAVLYSAGDFDKDGRDDLAVYSPGNVAAGTPPKLFLYRGPVAKNTSLLPSNAYGVLVGENPTDSLQGYDVVAGRDDTDTPFIAVSAPNNNGGGVSRGKVYVWKGPFDGTQSLSASVLTFVGKADNDRVGQALGFQAAVSAISNPPYLMVGAPFASYENPNGTNPNRDYARGEVHSTRINRTGQITLNTSTTRTLMYGRTPRENLGYSLASNCIYSSASGINEVFMGAPGSMVSGFFNEQTTPLNGDGAAYSYPMAWSRGSGSTDTAGMHISQYGESLPHSIGRAGMAVACVDFDKDGNSEFVYSAPTIENQTWSVLNAGAVYFLSHGTTYTTRGHLPNQMIGYGLAGLTSFTKRNKDAIVIGSPYHYSTTASVPKMGGNIYIKNSLPTLGDLLYVSADVVFEPESTTSGRLGLVVKDLGDVNGDGYRDFGTVAQDNNKAYVVYGKGR